MAKVYISLCRELDDVTMRTFHLSDKITRYKVKMEKVMENGYVNIAKARYIMGSRCVSKIQLPNENSEDIIPVSTLCRADYEGYHLFKLHRKLPTPSCRDEELTQEFGIDTTRSDIIRNNLMEELTAIFPTHVTEDDEYKYLKAKINRGSVDVESVTSDNVVDPLTWFGVLVPQTLRIAQKSFIEALEISASIATIQCELHWCVARCRHLYEVKRIVEISTRPLGLNIYFDRGYGSARIRSSQLLIPEAESVECVSYESLPKISIVHIPEEVEEEIFMPFFPSYPASMISFTGEMGSTQYDIAWSDKFLDSEVEDLSAAPPPSETSASEQEITAEAPATDAPSQPTEVPVAETAQEESSAAEKPAEAVPTEEPAEEEQVVTVPEEAEAVEETTVQETAQNEEEEAQ